MPCCTTAINMQIIQFSIIFKYLYSKFRTLIKAKNNTDKLILSSLLCYKCPLAQEVSHVSFQNQSFIGKI